MPARIANVAYALGVSISSNEKGGNVDWRRFRLKDRLGFGTRALELDQSIAGDGQLVPAVVELAESLVTSEVAASFRPNLNPLVGVIIESERDFLVIGVGSAEAARIESAVHV